MITSLTPPSGTASSLHFLTIAGSNLENASAILFFPNWAVPEGRGAGQTQLKDPFPDADIAVTNITSTATSVAHNGLDRRGSPARFRCAVLVTPNGTSTQSCAVFTVKPNPVTAK